jgi:NAD(P)-dependent dehydrogenase (short-subunit alcohol dehydrogenase family)
MKGAALELAEFGVRVNTIHPGYVETPMMDAIHESVSPECRATIWIRSARRSG